MYASHRGPGRSRTRSRAQSDPGHPYVTAPYTVQWPAPARQATEQSMGHPEQPRSPSRASSVERPGDPFVPSPGSLLSQSPQRSGLASGNFAAPQGPLIKEVPQPPRTAFNVMTVSPAPHAYPLGWAQQAPPTNPPPMQRQGSHHSVHQQQPGLYQITTVTHHHQSHHQPSPHHARHRSRSRPPSAASHRYASSFTPPVYGHGGSSSLNASRTSLNGGVPSQRNHHPTSPPPGLSIAHPPTELARTSSASPQRSRSHTRLPPPSSASETTATAVSPHKLNRSPPSPPSPPPAASELYRSTQRPQLPANYDGQTQTRYVSMLLALDGISPLFNIYSSFFTWILLAGFVLFPGTFASWKDEPAGSAQSDILDVIDHVSLYAIAWVCTGIGASGMIWLWWKWQNNYIWITNRIFVPGFLNSVAGVISTLSSVYGAQAGVFGKAELSTIIVTASLALICGILVIVYEFWLTRNLRLEHDRIVGVEMTGKHGEGVLGVRRERHI